jgi:hypothetical protein
MLLPEGSEKAMPERPHHTAKFKSCVEKVMAQGNDEASAHAICTTQFQKSGQAIFEAAEGHEEMRTLHILGATQKVRIEQYHGRPHLVVPVIALMEGVIHAVNSDEPEFVPAEVLERAAETWNSKPNVLQHPVRGGRQCSANAPDIIQAYGLGPIFNSRVEGKLLRMES